MMWLESIAHPLCSSWFLATGLDLSAVCFNPILGMLRRIKHVHGNGVVSTLPILPVYWYGRTYIQNETRCCGGRSTTTTTTTSTYVGYTANVRRLSNVSLGENETMMSLLQVYSRILPSMNERDLLPTLFLLHTVRLCRCLAFRCESRRGMAWTWSRWLIHNAIDGVLLKSCKHSEEWSFLQEIWTLESVVFKCLHIWLLGKKVAQVALVIWLLRSANTRVGWNDVVE